MIPHQQSSALANRAAVIEEASRIKSAARDLARLEKQRKLAEILRLKADAEERGEDVEREKNWEWTIEENEEWEKKLARKARRADFEFHGAFDVHFSHYAIYFLARSQMMRTRHDGNTKRTSINSSQI